MNRIFVFLIGIVLSLCGNVGAQADADATLEKINAMPQKKRNEILEREARKEGEVEWHSTLPVPEARYFIDRFNEKYPFVKVKYTRTSGTGVVNRLLTEYKAGTYRMDVIGSRGNLHSTLMKAGVVAKNLAPFRRELREGFIDEKGYFAGNFTYGLVIGYNSRNVPTSKVPAGYEDLLSPEWSNQMGLDQESYEWLAGMIDIIGDAKALSLARKLAAQKIRMVRGHTLLTQLVAAGELKVLLDVYHHQMISFKEKGAPIDFVIPETLIIKEPSGIWITRKAPRPHAAALLVDFLFSREGQEVYQKGNRMVARKDMEWNLGGKKLLRTHVISMDKWGDKYPELIKTFEQIFR
jgi:iron(III) transport system substrate-binding protein